MGLPTSIPSGGDGDSFNEPLPDVDLSSPLPAIEPQAPARDTSARDEFEEFQRWKREREAEAAQAAPRTRTQPARTSTRAERPVPVESQLQNHDELEATDDGGQWRVDPKTGKRYKTLTSTPKEAISAYRKTKGAGFSLSEMRSFVSVEDGFDIDDLNGAAETFMAHLRVPPSKEEREEILRTKAELVRKQKAKRAEIDAELNEKEGTLEEPEVDPFSENPPKKRGLFGRKN